MFSLIFILNFVCTSYLQSTHYTWDAIAGITSAATEKFKFFVSAQTEHRVNLNDLQDQNKKDQKIIIIPKQEVRDLLFSWFAKWINLKLNKGGEKVEIYKYLVKEIKFSPESNLIKFVWGNPSSINSENNEELQNQILNCLENEVVKFRISDEEPCRKNEVAWLSGKKNESSPNAEKYHNILIHLPKSIKTTDNTQIKIQFLDKKQSKTQPQTIDIGKFKKHINHISFNVFQKDLINILNGRNLGQANQEQSSEKNTESQTPDGLKNPTSENSSNAERNALSKSSYFCLIIENLTVEQNSESFNLEINFKNEINLDCNEKEEEFNFPFRINALSNEYYELGIQKLIQIPGNDQFVKYYSRNDLEERVNETWAKYSHEEREIIRLEVLNKPKRGVDNKSQNLSTLSIFGKKAPGLSHSKLQHTDVSSRGPARGSIPNTEHSIVEELGFYFTCAPEDFYSFLNEISTFFGFEGMNFDQSQLSPLRPRELKLTSEDSSNIKLNRLSLFGGRDLSLIEGSEIGDPRNIFSSNEFTEFIHEENKTSTSEIFITEPDNEKTQVLEDGQTEKAEDEGSAKHPQTGEKISQKDSKEKNSSRQKNDVEEVGIEGEIGIEEGIGIEEKEGLDEKPGSQKSTPELDKIIEQSQDCTDSGNGHSSCIPRNPETEKRKGPEEEEGSDKIGSKSKKYSSGIPVNQQTEEEHIDKGTETEKEHEKKLNIPQKPEEVSSENLKIKDKENSNMDNSQTNLSSKEAFKKILSNSAPKNDSQFIPPINQLDENFPESGSDGITPGAAASSDSTKTESSTPPTDNKDKEPKSSNSSGVKQKHEGFLESNKKAIGFFGIGGSILGIGAMIAASRKPQKSSPNENLVELISF